MRTSRVFMRDLTPAAPAALLLFGGRLEVAHDSAYVQVDGWLRIRCAPGWWLGGGCRGEWTSLIAQRLCMLRCASPSILTLPCILPADPRSAPAATAVLVKKMRQALDALLERKVRQPALKLEEAGGQLIAAVVDLLNSEEAALQRDR